MFFSYPFSLTNKYGFLHFVRGFIHLTVLLSLITYQFLFSSFINSSLSISLYSLCFIILFFDALYLFFYKDNKLFNQYFSLILLLLDACFFVILFTILEFVGLSFILSFIFLEIVVLSVLEGWFVGILFSFIIALLFPLSFVWQGDFSFEIRKSLVNLVLFGLVASVIFGSILRFILEEFRKKSFHMEESILHYKNRLSQYVSSYRLEDSLNLSRKIQPALNSLVKSFLEIKNKESFPRYYENQLKQLQKFIGKYTTYLESEEYIFKSVYLPQLLEDVLKRLQNHKDRPASLKERLQYKSSIKWLECSTEQLEIAIENIIENSFQALKNENHPKLNIEVYEEVDKIVLEFLDNGHGIEQKDQKNLFDPLFSKKMGIGGVGLAYVLKVVKAHKGEINIISSSQGTKVLVKLPVLTTDKSKMSLIA